MGVQSARKFLSEKSKRCVLDASVKGARILAIIDERRTKELARIHIAKKELGLDEDVYRDILKQVCNVDSAKDLDQPGRNKLMAYFRGKGWGKENYTKGRPHNMQAPGRKRQLSKIEALLAEAGRPWSYVDGMVKKICKVDKLEFCTPALLSKIIAALMKDAKRHGRRVS